MKLIIAFFYALNVCKAIKYTPKTSLTCSNPYTTIGRNFKSLNSNILLQNNLISFLKDEFHNTSNSNDSICAEKILNFVENFKKLSNNDLEG